MKPTVDLAEVAEFLRSFAEERDWERFHTPKNLAMAVAGEVGELVEIFQWLTPEESTELTSEVRHHVGEEIVDVFQYLVRLADVLGIDLDQAFASKFALNARRYPAAGPDAESN